MVSVAAFLLAGVLHSWRRRQTSATALVVLLAMILLLELGNVTGYSFPHQEKANHLVKNLSEHSDIATFLRNQGLVRVEVDEQVVPYNFGDWYGIEHFGGYLASITSNVSRVQADARVRAMYGVAFSVRNKPAHDGQQMVFKGRSGVNVYSKTGAFPRSWVVHEAGRVERDDEIGPRLTASTFDPRRQTFVKGTPPSLEKCSGSEPVELVSRDPGRLSMDATLGCRGMLIVADTWFPGWIATVDGKSAPIYEAYGFLRGVVVDAGRHRVEMRYRPRSVYWGAALTAVGLLGVCALGVVAGRRANR